MYRIEILVSVPSPKGIGELLHVLSFEDEQFGSIEGSVVHEVHVTTEDA